MDKIEGSVIYQSDGVNIEKALFTYDEDEKQDNEINKENAKLIFSPKFIPFYPKLLKLGLTHIQVLIFGFIDFYLQDNEKRFYFTNEQIGNLFGFGGQHISNCMKELKDKKLIDIKYKMKANGGKIRFIQKLYSDYNHSYSGSITTVIDNNNKINNNNKKNILLSKDNNTKSDDFVSKNRKDIDLLIIEIKQLCNEMGVAYDKIKERMFGKHICDSIDYGEFCKNIGLNRLEFSKKILLASVKINYRKGPCSGTMKIYQNYVEVYNLTKSQNKKEKEKKGGVGFLTPLGG